MRRVSLSVLVLLVVVAGVAASTSSFEPQTARRDGALTAVGAERAANADGSIPAYTGGLPKAAMEWNTGYKDPFAGDTVLYTITAQNAEQYKDVLSAGHQILLKRDARTFRMKVYPTHRSAAYPEDVLAEVAKQAPLVKQDGYRVLNTGHTTVPFPVPTDGLQVMWNHIFRWRGGSVERQHIWAPVTAGGGFFVVRYRTNTAWDAHGYVEESRPNRLYDATQFFMSPPSLIGVRNAQWEPINEADDARVRWLYVPQTVDTKRLPAFGYDMAEPATNNLRLADQNDGWNGSPDRFDWKLIGKRELLIGYNAYRLMDRTLRYADIIRPRNLDPDLLRYEKHRVWVVEATRRKSHVFAKRIFYVDEDTWQVAQEEDFNEKGQLGRFGDHHMIQYYDVTVPWYAATIHHDLKSGAYIVTYLQNQEPFPTRWGFKARLAEYLPSYLRVLGLPG